jgi:serine/threonine-protein phosphatase 2A regulatory subunit A
MAVGTSNSSAGSGSVSSSSSSQLSNQAVTQLIDDLRNTDLQVRLNSFRKIQLIAQALGPARTRGELIPYLCEFCDDDDEVLLLLAAHLGEMTEAVGGPEHAHVLLTPLEQLAGSEETAVREKAVQALSKVAEQLNEHALLEHFLPLLRRTANADWFTSRISATALFPIIYPRLPQPGVDDPTKKELRALYANLCKKEETPMVKRAAAANLGVRQIQRTDRKEMLEAVCAHACIHSAMPLTCAVVLSVVVAAVCEHPGQPHPPE